MLNPKDWNKWLKVGIPLTLVGAASVYQYNRLGSYTMRLSPEAEKAYSMEMEIRKEANSIYNQIGNWLYDDSRSISPSFPTYPTAKFRRVREMADSLMAMSKGYEDLIGETRILEEIGREKKMKNDRDNILTGLAVSSFTVGALGLSFLFIYGMEKLGID